MTNLCNKDVDIDFIFGDDGLLWIDRFDRLWMPGVLNPAELLVILFVFVMLRIALMRLTSRSDLS